MTRTTLGPRETCPPDHKHAASHTCYKIHRCGCGDCRTASTADARRRERAKLYGRFDSGLVDAEPVREHLRYLSENGIGYKRAAAIAGVSRTGVRAILFGRQDPGPRRGEVPARTEREKAERLLALRVDYATIAPGARVSSRGVHRRVQALVTTGWTQTALAARLGIQPGNLSGVLSRDHVTASFHLRVAALYDELWNQRPPRETPQQLRAFQRATGTAAKHGWLPPLAWDDIDQDPHPPVPDEDDLLDELAVEHTIAGHEVRLTRAERLEVVGRLTTAGRTGKQIAEVVGVTGRQIVRDLADYRARQEQTA